MALSATELMIGDLVQLKGHLDYDKVREIAMDENMEWYISFACSATLFRAYEYAPIPLTPEILEKNNFSDVDNISINQQIGFVHWYHIDRIGALEEPLITQDLNSGTYSLIYRDNAVHALRYAHELQHALRVCWLTDLADNFKV